MQPLLRSILYLPLSNAKALSRTLTLTHCDGFIFDLEDAVAPADKPRARANFASLFPDPSATPRSLFSRRQVVLRLNSIHTPDFPLDLALAQATRPDAVLLAKSELPGEIAQLQALLPPTTKIWAMVETPTAVLNAPALAATASALVMGTVDLANELQCSTDPALQRQPLTTALQSVVLAARAHNKPAIDGVHIHLQDAAGFELECRQGLALGFSGKTLIHPNQIAPCNQVFSPSPDAVARARKIIEAYRAANSGVTVLDGRLVEALHVRRAQALLESHALISSLT